MPVPDEFRDYVLGNLEPLGQVRARAMFGGYGVFENGDMFALMSGAALFFKVDDATRGAYEDAGSEPYGRMPYFKVPAHVVEDSSTLEEWAGVAIAVGHSTARRKRSKQA